ncbi:hypothetical protein CRV00_11775 [Malaciobacter molluscorum]|uniref:DMT family transporter n=1 Tax=Malaciobacter molluscorum TaxID=1032072 RepID=UPI00100B6AC7|nr:DMT family transporter [Malaciobacter molluscorum]RXJ93325.1 hypothetical protein CRV00_11775 [Malaciobacter molluscorum]
MKNNQNSQVIIANVNKGMVYMLLAVLILPFTDALGKYLSTSLSPTQIVFLRYFLQFIFLLPFFIFSKKRIETFKIVYLYLGVCVSISIILLFWGLKYLPLANSTALFFAEPLFLTILSIVFLNEKITRNHLIALFLGLIGTLIIIRPNFSLYGIASFLPIGSAFFYALYLIFIRISTDLGSKISVQFYNSIVASIFIFIFLIVGQIYDIDVMMFKSIDSSLYILIFCLGFLAVIVQLLISSAFYHAKASSLASFQYLEIISATFLGWLIFNNTPDELTILGAIIVICSGIYLARHENKSSKAISLN